MALGFCKFCLHNLCSSASTCPYCHSTDGFVALPDTAFEAIHERDLVRALRIVKDATGFDLKKAKSLVESLAR